MIVAMCSSYWYLRGFGGYYICVASKIPFSFILKFNGRRLKPFFGCLGACYMGGLEFSVVGHFLSYKIFVLQFPRLIGSYLLRSLVLRAQHSSLAFISVFCLNYYYLILFFKKKKKRASSLR